MLLSSSNKEYTPFPLLSYFSVAVCMRFLFSVTYCVYIPGKKQDFVFIVIVQLMMNANSRIRFGLQIVLVCLYITPCHYYHCANLPEDIELIKCLSDIYFVEFVSNIKHILSAIPCTICGAVYSQCTHFPCDY